MEERKSMIEFGSYLLKHNNEQELIKIQRKVKEVKTADDYIGIQQHATELLGHREYVSTCLAKFNQLLDNATFEYLPEKTKSNTDVDRKSFTDMSVSAIRYWRDVTKGIVDTIDKQVSFAQTVLSFKREESKSLSMATS